MACTYTCDGCGIGRPAREINGEYHHPEGWFIRADKDGVQVACSRECIKEIADKTGKTTLVFPF